MHRHLCGGMQIQTKESTQLSIPETWIQLLFAVLRHADTNKKRASSFMSSSKQLLTDILGLMKEDSKKTIMCITEFSFGR